MSRPEEVIRFWFAPAHKHQWFANDPVFDEDIRRRFLSLYDDAMAGRLYEWASGPEGALALILLFDQFPRNMFRNTPRAFASDEKALQLSQEMIRQQTDVMLNREERLFVYMPFLHSERLHDQEEGIKLFAALEAVEQLVYARRYRDIIVRFGRFPHRNEILGRISTPNELSFLQQEGGNP